MIPARLFLECVFDNGLFARDTSRKIRAVFKAKGNSGKPLATRPPYGYKKSEFDKDIWVVDDEAAAVVRKIFQMCIEGFGPAQIARKLSEQQVLIPTAYLQSKGKNTPHTFKKPYRWCEHTVAKILESMEYAGHTVNFKSQIKSYKCKKRINHAKEDWVVFENTHEAIVSQHDFDLVQEIMKSNPKMQKCEEINPFSGIVYCADCGKKLHINRGKSISKSQEYMKCATYTTSKGCSAHYIRTAVLREILLNEINKLLETVRLNEDEFVRAAMENSLASHNEELKKAKKTLSKSNKRIDELDKIISKLYEDNVLGKISDERFEVLSKGYEVEQAQLKQTVNELTAFIEAKEQKSADTSQFLEIVRKYTEITELTPEIIRELVEKIVVHAPDKSSGHREQQIDIYYRFNIAVSTAIADNREYGRKRKAA